MIARLTQRNPWLGAVVLRLTCQGNFTRSPTGLISLTARHVGHSKWETPVSSSLEIVTSMTSVKEHPAPGSPDTVLVSQTGSRMGARLPTGRLLGLGVSLGKGRGEAFSLISRTSAFGVLACACGASCNGYLEYPFEKNTKDVDSIALVRYISCDHFEAFFLHFV